MHLRCALLTLTFLLASVLPAHSATSLMLDWYPNPNHATLNAAKTQGFFADQGLEVDLQVPADPNDPLKLVAAGKVDFAVSYQPTVLQARAEGLPVVAVGALVQHPLSCVLYRKDQGITSPADFKGKRIGYSVEPLYRVLFETVAGHAGLTPEDYETVRVGFNLTQPLLSGKIAGSAGAFRNYEAVQAELEGFDVGVFAFEEYGVPDFYELVLIANAKTVSEAPEKVAGLINALKQGTEWTLENPKRSREAFFASYPDSANELNRRAFEATLPFFKGSPAQTRQRWEALETFMRDKGLLNNPVDLDTLVWQPE